MLIGLQRASASSAAISLISLGILGQPEQIVDVVQFAPGHQLVAREPRIRPQQNAHLGPTFADLRDDPRHLFNRASAGIDVGAAQLGKKQMPSAKIYSGR